jgi:hypothetical protein
VSGEFAFEEGTSEREHRCWCGRPLEAGAPAWVVRRYPEGLEVLRDKRFHSAACAVAFAASMATVMEANLTQPAPPRVGEELRREREQWRRLVEYLTPLASAQPP